MPSGHTDKLVSAHAAGEQAVTARTIIITDVQHEHELVGTFTVALLPSS